jgi:hypothetical protein
VRQATTGVGAVAEARGEITIYDGKLIVSYGREASRVGAETESAALLSIATVPGWQTITVEQDVAPADIEGFLAQMAAARELKPDSSFPFQIRGTLASYVMHVNAAPTNGPHGMGHMRQRASECGSKTEVMQTLNPKSMTRRSSASAASTKYSADVCRCESPQCADLICASIENNLHQSDGLPGQARQ